MGKISQEEMVLDYCRTHRGISSFEAFGELGVTRLSAKIFNLKKRGYMFKKERHEVINRFGNACHYDRYILILEADDNGINN